LDIVHRRFFFLMGLAALAAAAISTRPGIAQCPTPVLDHAYQNEDGETVNVYRLPAFVSYRCMDTYERSLYKHLMWGGNSTGTQGFEVAEPSGPKKADHCAVRMIDGTAMMMKGLPRITGGRFVFTDATGHLFQVPLQEVVSTDSGKRFHCKSCTRDAAGKPLGNPAVKEAFARANPCPAGGPGTVCSGYVVDHVTPLACGGDDDAANLQWQTAAEAKRKEAWSETACEP